jgi:hypothetical protein
VLLQEASESLTLTSEMTAAWYRYLNGWRLHKDGTIEAIFQYAGTENSCMCNPRTHHAYWRFDWAIAGTEDAGAVGGWKADSAIEQLPAGGTTWIPISSEAAAMRVPGGRLRVLDRPSADSPRVAYEVIAGASDGTALNDAFAVADAWYLRWNPNESEDFGLYSIELGPYLNGEDLERGRIVLWYAAHIRQEGNTAGAGDVCATVGPTLKRSAL